MKQRSIQLPPLLPDDTTHGHPSFSDTIFGPNKSISIWFVAMENRKSTIRVTLATGSSYIKDTAGTTWNENPYTLVSDNDPSHLPWQDTILLFWNGLLASGVKIGEGLHTITFKIKDYDDNDSLERTRNIEYDATKPTGTITPTIIQ